jgi:hypothetical protein
MPRLRRQAGAAAVEFQIVALFAMLPLCLGMLQLALLMAENHHIDHAAFMAARRAAMTHGDLGEARRAFVQAALPLTIRTPDELDRGNISARVARAYAETLADVTLYARFSVVSPDSDAVADFAIQRLEDQVIPNDGLEYRSVVAGRRSGLTLQQANVLRLEVSWCRPLIVPFIRELLIGLLRRVNADAGSQLCYARGRLPIRSEGVTPMQSDFRASS